VARNAGKESKKDHKHREKDNKEIKASKKEFMENGSEPLMRLGLMKQRKRGERLTPLSGMCRCRVRVHRLIFDSFTEFLTLHFANRND